LGDLLHLSDDDSRPQGVASDPSKPSLGSKSVINPYTAPAQASFSYTTASPFVTRRHACSPDAYDQDSPISLPGAVLSLDESCSSSEPECEDAYDMLFSPRCDSDDRFTSPLLNTVTSDTDSLFDPSLCPDIIPVTTEVSRERISMHVSREQSRRKDKEHNTGTSRLCAVDRKLQQRRDGIDGHIWDRIVTWYVATLDQQSCCKDTYRLLLSRINDCCRLLTVRRLFLPPPNIVKRLFYLPGCSAQELFVAGGSSQILSRDSIPRRSALRPIYHIHRIL